MNVREYAIYSAERGLAQLFAAARDLPEGKLDWSPKPGVRSALDQLQEVVTAMQAFVDEMKAREVTFDEDQFGAWVMSRSQLQTMADLEAAAEEGMVVYREYVRGLSDEDFDLLVSMPFPGEWKVADMVIYHPWNIAYHLGQISYIKSLLEAS